MSFLLKIISPDVGLSKPDSTFSRVVLPEPEGPVMATLEDFSKLKSISFNTSTTPSP